MSQMSDYLSHDEVEDAMPLSRREQFAWFQTNYNRMAPEDRYWKTLEIYSGDIFGFPKKYLIALKSIKPNDYLKDLPNELTDVDPITVYRGTDALESVGTVRSGISWTINKNVAIWFSQRFCTTGKVFAATIEKKKIIGFITSRNEDEVVQHCNVKNVVEIIPTQEEIRGAIEAHAKSIESHTF